MFAINVGELPPNHMVQHPREKYAVLRLGFFFIKVCCTYQQTSLNSHISLKQFVTHFNSKHTYFMCCALRYVMSIVQCRWMKHTFQCRFGCRHLFMFVTNNHCGCRLLVVPPIISVHANIKKRLLPLVLFITSQNLPINLHIDILKLHWSDWLDRYR